MSTSPSLASDSAPSLTTVSVGMSDSDIALALQTVQVAAGHKGNIKEGKAILESGGLVPASRPVLPKEVMEDDERAQSPVGAAELLDTAAEEAELTRLEGIGSWADESQPDPIDDMDDLLDELAKSQQPPDDEAFGDLIQEQPVPLPAADIEADQETTTLNMMFRRLYDGLSDGINKILEETNVIRQSHTVLMSQVRVLRDEQASLRASVKGLQDSLNNMACVDA